MEKNHDVHFEKIYKMHTEDIYSTLKELKKYGRGLKNLNYFINISSKCMINELRNNGNEEKPKVAILGLNFPEEIIYAANLIPVWVLGGSHAASVHADKFVPRDTDPASQSAFGYMDCEVFTSSKNIDLAIVPITSDNMRKIAYLLSDKVEVFPLDIPTSLEDENFMKKLMFQFNLLFEKLQNLNGINITNNNLCNSLKMVNHAKFETEKFIKNFSLLKEYLASSIFLTVINSYYLTGDIVKWTKKLMLLNMELEELKAKIRGNNRYKVEKNLSKKPCVLLTGSPIYFPNMKIPNLMDQLGIGLSYAEFEMTNRVFVRPKSKLVLKRNYSNIIKSNYYDDISTSFVFNKNRIDNIMKIIDENQIDGVIYHVLKGHVCYDFELDFIEDIFVKKNIPFFRLETDYNKQDVEQLRIRTEAFFEMLSMKINNVG